MRSKFTLIIFLYTALISALANCYLLLERNIHYLFPVVLVFLFVNFFAGTLLLNSKQKSLNTCCHGGIILGAFALSAIISVIYHVILAIRLITSQPFSWIWSTVFCISAELIIFWNGMISVYGTSSQLSVKQRVIGILFGLIPIANIIVSFSIIQTALSEVAFEYEKEKQNESRALESVCSTKYPILMVHGVFFRDTQFFNYWGRIPQELERNGARVYYGNHQSALSVEASAAELTERIKALVTQLNCEKVNIIAHSKGGLDCRYAISKSGAAPYVASLTTISTPHKGCLFADYLLTKISPKVKNSTAAAYNATLRRLGEKNPDFLSAVSDLTAERCIQFDRELQIPEGVFCQSVGSIMPTARDGQFPLNFSYHLVKHFDGPNDGMVSINSFNFGEKLIMLTPPGTRGISHGDMIDLNRTNIDGFDVREFYVNLVSDLKNKGL